MIAAYSPVETQGPQIVRSQLKQFLDRQGEEWRVRATAAGVLAPTFFATRAGFMYA